MDYQGLYEAKCKELEYATLKLRVLKKYVILVENERDYYMESSEFGGIKPIPRPEETADVKESRTQDPLSRCLSQQTQP